MPNRTSFKSHVVSRNKFKRKNDSKSRPNFFLGLRIRDKQVIRNIAKVQAKLLSNINDNNMKLMRKTLVSPVKAHITLGVFRLDTYHAIEQALQSLELCQDIVSETLTHKIDKDRNVPHINLRGISHFRRRVLYGAVHNDEHFFRLTEFADQVSQVFRKTSIPLKSNQPFTPHVTVAKIREQGLLFPHEVCNDLKSHNLGEATFDSLDLTQMRGLDNDGYYPVVGSIPLIKRKK